MVPTNCFITSRDSKLRDGLCDFEGKSMLEDKLYKEGQGQGGLKRDCVSWAHNDAFW